MYGNNSCYSHVPVLQYSYCIQFQSSLSLYQCTLLPICTVATAVTAMCQYCSTVTVYNSLSKSPAFLNICPPPRCNSPSGPGLPHCRGFSITHRCTTFRTPLDKWSARRSDIFQHTTLTRDTSTPWRDSNPQSQQRAAADTRLRPDDRRDRPLDT